MCVRASVCWYYFANLRLYCVCMSAGAHRDTKKHIHTQVTLKNTAKYMSSDDRKSTLSLQYSISVLSHEKHTHSLKL